MTDGKKYIFLNPINKININIPNFKMFTSKEEMLGNLIISIYDTPPSVNPPIKCEKSTYNNGMIDPEEFSDTKEDYEKNIEKIKQYCKKYGQDISEIKLPTYDDMQYLCGRAIDAETMASFLMPKKTLDEEIGLGNVKYKTTPGCESEYREYENGTNVEILYSGNYLQQIIIDNEAKRIIKKFDITGTKVLEQEFNEKLKTNKIIEYYPSNGQIRTIRRRDLDSSELIETIDYDKNGSRILNENQKLAHELIKDLTNTNFIKLKSVRSSLQDNLNKLTTENVEEVLIEFKRTTGLTLVQKIEEMRCSIDSLYEFFSMKPYTTTDKLKDKIKETLISTYQEGRNINDMQSFLDITGIGNEFEVMLNDKSFQYNYFASYWKALTGRDSFELDFLNSNLPTEIKAQYNRVIWHEACSRLDIKPNLKIENSQIKNKYYSSDMVYDVQYNLHTDWIGGTITIHNKTTGVSRTIDFNELCKNMSEIDYCDFLTNIQKLPAEVLEDAFVEFKELYGHSGKEAELKNLNADGFYRNNELTVISPVRQGNQVHELGHAIDYNYLSGKNNNSSSCGNFYETFTKEMDEYIKKGNVCYTGTENPINPKDGLCNYCTTNEKEMFAECYTLLMTGNCNSKETILKYFRKTLQKAEKLLKEIRKLPDNVRLTNNI